MEKIRRWKRKKQSAPHKPLLMLFALGELSLGRKQIPYNSIYKKKFNELLENFGPTRSNHHPEDPFVRLEHDELWRVTADKKLKKNKSGGVSDRELVNKNAIGRFPDEFLSVLEASQGENIRIVARQILDSNFPGTLHQDILDAVGLDLTAQFTKRSERDRAFREKVLHAYDGQCCVCGFDLLIGNQNAFLEAAHIKWHAAGGPDKVINGLALCLMHHKAFDIGAFTVQENKSLVACKNAVGRSQKEWLTAFHGKSLRSPRNSDYHPGPEYLKWHRDNIFRDSG